MLVEYRDNTPFARGWQPPAHYDSAKLFYDQPAYADYRAFQGIAYTASDYSFWNDRDHFAEIRVKLGNFEPLLTALNARVMLSLGSGRPIWEVLISAQMPTLRIVASDINCPENVATDLRNGTGHGFPTAANISYIRLDIRDPVGLVEHLQSFGVDTLFICSCFFVATDAAWKDFLSLVKLWGVRNVILFHTEAISPLNACRYLVFGSNRRGALMGFLRSTSTVVHLFTDAGYAHHASYVPPQGGAWWRRSLAAARLHYAHKGYVFSTDSLDTRIHGHLRSAMTGAGIGR